MPTKRKEDLLDLAAEEGLLLEQVRALDGTIEEKTQQLTDLGVFGAYADIHRNYVRLAKEGDQEALKRALFLQWFEVAEPAFLTGLSDLDADEKSVALALAEKECSSQNLDDEFRWMVPYYYLIAEWFVQESGQVPNLIEFCRSHVPTGRIVPQAAVAFDGRGQMGDYWESLRKS